MAPKGKKSSVPPATPKSRAKQQSKPKDALLNFVERQFGQCAFSFFCRYGCFNLVSLICGLVNKQMLKQSLT